MKKLKFVKTFENFNLNEEWTPGTGKGEVYYNDSVIEINGDNLTLIRRESDFSSEKENWIKMIDYLSSMQSNKVKNTSIDEIQLELDGQCVIKNIIAPFGVHEKSFVSDLGDLSFLEKYGRIYERKRPAGSIDDRESKFKFEVVCELNEPFRMRPQGFEQGGLPLGDYGLKKTTYWR